MGIRNLIQKGLWPSKAQGLGMFGERDPEFAKVQILYQPTLNDTGIVELAKGLQVGIAGDAGLRRYAGVGGRGIAFDGVTDAVSVADQPGLTLAANLFALETKVVFYKAGMQSICGQAGAPNDANTSIRLYKDAQNKIVFRWRDTGGSDNMLISPAAVDLGRELYIAAVRASPYYINLFINTTRVAQLDLNATVGSGMQIADSTRLFKLGSYDGTDTATSDLQGVITGLRLSVTTDRLLRGTTTKVPTRFPIKG